MLAGFVFSLLFFFVEAFSPGYPSGGPWDYVPVDWIMDLCPPSFFILYLLIPGHGNIPSQIFAHIVIVVANTVLYGLIGGLISQVYQFLKRRARPGTA